MKKLTFITAVVLTLLAVSLPLYAQSGCGDSPENPTFVLALAGAAGVLYVQVRGRLKARGNARRK